MKVDILQVAYEDLENRVSPLFLVNDEGVKRLLDVEQFATYVKEKKAAEDRLKAYKDKYGFTYQSKTNQE